MPIFDKATKYAPEMLARRAEQDTIFGIPLRGTLAWDLLLVLFLADAEGRSLTGQEVVAEGGCSQEVGKRWLAYLVQEGLVVSPCPKTPSSAVAIAPYAITVLEAYVERCPVYR